MRLFALLAGTIAATVPLSGQPYEIGANIGYGFYNNGTIFSPAGSVTAGIRNRFAAGVVLGEDLYDYISGEIRYLYHDGHPFLSGPGFRTDIQGQSHTFTYEILIHVKDQEHRLRPYVALGGGAKGYIIAGPEPFPQPVPGIATLNARDEWKPVASFGGGLKWEVREHLLLRLDFRDYLTTFPKRQIAPAPHNTARGIFQQFTPMFGVSYRFGS